MEALVTKLLDFGPLGYLTVASLLLNVALLLFVRRLWDIIITLSKEAVSAIALSTDAVKAANESRDEMVAAAKDHHHAQMLAFGRIESLIAIVRAGRGIT